ncbi:MAG: hypothetical protein FJ184_00210 [Gammaproteobacteria bacterium]|nr:hypothetical protein [Gammaproteobacteria bacterium]
MQSTTRFFHAHSSVLYPIKRQTTGIPDVYTQANNLNGVFTRINYGLPEGSVANFSSSILKHKNKTYLAWRSQPEPFGFRWDNNYFYLNDKPTDIYLGLLHDDQTVVGAKNLRPNKHRLSYEDPRLFVGPDDELYVQFVASTYASRHNKHGRNFFDNPKVVVCYVDELGEAVQAAIPPIGENRSKEKTEKNWCFFSHKEELKCLYSTRPLVIECEKSSRVEIDSSALDAVTNGSPTFNSTAPINLGYAHLVFYHWKHMARKQNGAPYLQYHLSAYLVDKEFKTITHVIKKPLFSGSLNDELIYWTDYGGAPLSNQPAVILPFGAYIENANLVMSLGVNDAFMGIMRCPLESVMKQLERVS